MTTLATSPISRFVLLAKDIKLSHSVFALPFAVLAAFLAAEHDGRRLSAPLLGLIVLCMVLARTVAMAMNRWADRDLDGYNPRTAGRAIPSGRLSAGFVLATAVVCSLGFITAAAGFIILNDNHWPLILSPVVLLWLASYSFTKRFTWLCHLVLGSALAISPLAATVAIEPAFLGEPTPYLLALMVMCWVAGFDIIYALQDVEVDRDMSVHSIPSRLGVEPALWISRTLHLAALAALVAMWQVSTALHAGFAVGIVIVAALLILEHVIVWRSRTHYINLAFFTVNGLISVALGVLGVIDVMRRL